MTIRNAVFLYLCFYYYLLKIGLFNFNYHVIILFFKRVRNK